MVARDHEEIVPAVHVRIAVGRVLHIGISENILEILFVLIHIDALQFVKAGTLIPEMVGPPSRDAVRRPVRFPNGNPLLPLPLGRRQLARAGLLEDRLGGMRHLRRRLLVELSGLDVVDEPFGLARHERLGADLPTAQVLGLHGIHDLDSLAAARRPDQVERSADASRLDERGDLLAGGLGVRDS